MSAKAYNWNVIVRGSWNRAIFSPAWIAKEVFCLGDGTPIEVQVAIDTIGPLRVRHDQVIVSVNNEVLEVIAEDHSFSGLSKAMKVAAKALEKLPVTPVTAAGFNVRYRFDEVPGQTVELFDSLLDDRLCTEYSIISRGLSRQIRPRKDQLNAGVVTMSASLGSMGGTDLTIELNFHRDSRNWGELKDWLEIPSELVKEVTLSLCEYMLVSEVMEESNA